MKYKEFSEKYGIKFTTHSGKLEGIQSLNTSVALNPICTKRAQCAGSVCAKCYASALVKMRKGLRENIANNTRILTAQVIPVKEWPIINARVFRFESFGDLMNEKQIINYFNFAKRNPKITFTLWTKNPEIIARAIEGGNKKPRNLIIIQSSFHMNRVDAPRYDFIDKVFTVYDKQFIAENNITVNCGARNCLECGRCYRKAKQVEYVNEKLK